MGSNLEKYSGCRIFSEAEFEETDVLMQMMLAARQQIVLRKALCKYEADSMDAARILPHLSGRGIAAGI